jgi:hypothetical protein
VTIRKNAGLFLLSAAGAICFGQGSISGKIVTAAGAGAPIPGAPVQATNLDTKGTYKAISASDGSYNLSGLAPGAYEISVTNVTFFLPFRESSVQVAAGKTTRLDIRLDDFQLGTLGDGGEQFAQILKGGGLLAAERATASSPAPRTSDGKPDLSGVWGTAIIPKLLGDAPQPLPWAEAASKERGKRGRITDLGTAACLPAGINNFGPPGRIVQTPSEIVIIDGGFNPPREIYPDGRALPKDFYPSWMGHSVGHWEGDTLVVDTVGFNDLGWVVRGRPRFPKPRDCASPSDTEGWTWGISMWKRPTTIPAHSKSRSRLRWSVRWRRRTTKFRSMSATRTTATCRICWRTRRRRRDETRFAMDRRFSFGRSDRDLLRPGPLRARLAEGF